MPVRAEEQNGKWRIIEVASGQLARRQNGDPVDGGGHTNKRGALRQAAAINQDQQRKGEVQ